MRNSLERGHDIPHANVKRPPTSFRGGACAADGLSQEGCPCDGAAAGDHPDARAAVRSKVSASQAERKCRVRCCELGQEPGQIGREGAQLRGGRALRVGAACRAGGVRGDGNGGLCRRQGGGADARSVQALHPIPLRVVRCARRPEQSHAAVADCVDMRARTHATLLPLSRDSWDCTHEGLVRTERGWAGD